MIKTERLRQLDYFYYPSYQSVDRLHNPCFQQDRLYRCFDDEVDWVYVSNEDVYESWYECVEIVTKAFKEELLNEYSKKFRGKL